MIREMTPEDVLGVLEIEMQCFSDPWSFDMINKGLESSLDTWLVLWEEGAAAGYCVFRTIADECELLRIAVLPELRGRGLSKKLMDQMVFYSRQKEVKSIFLEVRESNDRARNLYKSYGFVEEGIRKHYYSNPSENAVLMVCYHI
ncbi:ribosomal-protein-alanine N-acetyltransferase [Lacrimispora xylanisolvens]|jgi:ribosomal-protein-alanine N-acetyltransferase|uniref:[Ribosomal protein bS18]-alanine N-acetyltransferase n=1 Tax=Lacrimispora xylanisolvens TaxID=384636 RepID=A0A2S6HZV5_9FIRM|nr:ribosomal protein S18-alanine N-acetyltransferase [Hungatella xylanolytica]MBE5988362.1 ribosomal-protein-alanine N-acetyltransferase [Paenibacillaceae bacterium]PPK83600.1 ribosomal-protein-alanine N-acetyltransferase [Hungatella xylanolytica]